MTNQEGDVPRTPADWQDYFNGTVTQRAIDDFNLSSVRPVAYPITPPSTEEPIPAPLTLATLPVAALEHATYRATAVTRATPDERSTLDWFRRQLASGHEVVFDFAGGLDPSREDTHNDNSIWDPPATINRDTITFGHSMLLVGYDNEQRAFLVKNSWGEAAPILFSYDFVTRGLVQEAHVFTAVADPAAGTPAAPCSWAAGAFTPRRAAAGWTSIICLTHTGPANWTGSRTNAWAPTSRRPARRCGSTERSPTGHWPSITMLRCPTCPTESADAGCSFPEPR